MSASREKNKRKELAQSGIQDDQSQKKGMSKGGKTALTVVIAVIVVAAIVFFSLLSTGFFAKHTTAATVGGHKLTSAMVNYYANDAYTNFSSSYGTYASMFFDTNTPLSKQYVDADKQQSWYDYFVEQGLQTAAKSYAVYDEAIANGFTLTEEQESALQTQLSTLNSYATLYGYNNTDAFLVARFGAGSSLKSYEQFLRVSTVAQYYASSLNEARTYTTEQIDAEYTANTNNYDGVTYRSFYFAKSSYATENESGEELTEEQQKEQSALQMAAAKADADAMLAAISDEQSFAEQALAYAPEDSKSDYEDDTATLSSDKLYSACPSDIAEWLFDTARAEGDTDCIEGESGYYVVYFISRDIHDEITKNVRHILIPVSDSTDEELVASAQSKAAELLSQFLAGDDTSEEAFEKFSNDLLEAGTASEATKYESVYPGQMVESFENWCYDESRQPGDTGIVDSTYGSHIMFFCGNSEKTYRDVLVENALRQADYSAWFENATKDASYTISSFGIAFTNKF